MVGGLQCFSGYGLEAHSKANANQHDPNFNRLVPERRGINVCRSAESLSYLISIKNHSFWKLDNITLWPHVAAETNPNTAAEQIANAIKCLNENIIPPNIVNRDLGY